MNNIFLYKKKQAHKEKHLYSMIGYPSLQDFIKLVKFKILPDYKVLEEDIRNDREIYWVCIHSLTGNIM